jgi:hypothetical protein
VSLAPAQPLAQPARLPLDQLVLDQEREALVERELVRRLGRELLLKGGGHAAQAQLVQLVKEQLVSIGILSGEVTGPTHVVVRGSG